MVRNVLLLSVVLLLAACASTGTVREPVVSAALLACWSLSVNS